MLIQVDVLIQYAQAYDSARKRDKSVLLDEVTALTGWTRDHARKRLGELADGVPGESDAELVTTYSDESIALLEIMWTASGGMSGRYLAEALPHMLANLERDPCLDSSRGVFAPAVRDEVRTMSAATINRYMGRARASSRSTVPRVFAGRLAKYLIRTRARCRQHGEEPGTFLLRVLRGAQGDTGPRTVVLIDTHTRWVSVRTAADVGWGDLFAALREAIVAIPYGVMAIHDTADALPQSVAARWSAALGIQVVNPADGPVDPDRFVLPAPAPAPADSRDMATSEAMNRLWALLADRTNLMCPFKLGVAEGATDEGDDELWTPVDRLRSAGVLSQPQERRVLAMRRNHCPVHVARAIEDTSADVCQRVPDKVISVLGLDDGPEG